MNHQPKRPVFYLKHQSTFLISCLSIVESSFATFEDAQVCIRRWTWNVGLWTCPERYCVAVCCTAFSRTQLNCRTCNPPKCFYGSKQSVCLFARLPWLAWHPKWPSLFVCLSKSNLTLCFALSLEWKRQIASTNCSYCFVLFVCTKPAIHFTK